MADADADGEGDAEDVADADAVAVAVPLADAVEDADGEGDANVDGLDVLVDARLCDVLGVWLAVSPGACVGAWLDADAVWLIVGSATSAMDDGCALAIEPVRACSDGSPGAVVAALDAEAVAVVGAADADGVAVGVADGVDDAVDDDDADASGDVFALTEAVAVAEGVAVAAEHSGGSPSSRGTSGSGLSGSDTDDSGVSPASGAALARPSGCTSSATTSDALSMLAARTLTWRRW